MAATTVIIRNLTYYTSKIYFKCLVRNIPEKERSCHEYEETDACKIRGNFTRNDCVFNLVHRLVF
jgi:hypothetical protein